MVQHVCYACEKQSENNAYYRNASIDGRNVIGYLCVACFNAIIRRTKRFQTDEERNAWLSANNKGQIPPNKGKRLYLNRKCEGCGSERSFIDKRGIMHWRFIRDPQGKPTKMLCVNCYSRAVSNKAEWKREYSRCTIRVKKKPVHLPFRPRQGKCERCGKSVLKGEIRCTVIHHEEYHDADPLKGTVELCESCHVKRGHELGQLYEGFPKGDSNPRWTGGKPRIKRWNGVYKAFRKKMLEQAGFRCTNCARTDREATLEIHHIKPYHTFPQLRYEPSNIEVLCEACHKQEDRRLKYQNVQYNSEIMTNQEREQSQGEEEQKATTVKKETKTTTEEKTEVAE